MLPIPPPGQVQGYRGWARLPDVYGPAGHAGASVI